MRDILYLMMAILGIHLYTASVTRIFMKNSTNRWSPRGKVMTMRLVLKHPWHVTIFGPAVEELIFRVFPITAVAPLIKYYGIPFEWLWLSAPITAILFALMHTQLSLQWRLVYNVPFALVMSYIFLSYVKETSLDPYNSTLYVAFLACTFVHGGCNALSLMSIWGHRLCRKRDRRSRRIK